MRGNEGVALFQETLLPMHRSENILRGNEAKDNRKIPWSVLLFGNHTGGSNPPRMLTQCVPGCQRTLGRVALVERNTINRHRGSGHPLSPATPPYMRVRIRRFSGWEPEGAQ